MSPYQARYGFVPDVSYLQRFGCLCYCHIPQATRDKGFIDESYKSYFLGIDMPTQAYKVWVIKKTQVKISSYVIFDEFTKTQLPENTIVPVAAQTRNKNDFLDLIGMVYRDDEN